MEINNQLYTEKLLVGRCEIEPLVFFQVGFETLSRNIFYLGGRTGEGVNGGKMLTGTISVIHEKSANKIYEKLCCINFFCLHLIKFLIDNRNFPFLRIS